MNFQAINGDLISLAHRGDFELIAHGCNCFHVMGAGIAKAISFAWPEALEADKSQSKRGDLGKLGTFSLAEVRNAKSEKLLIANLYTQYKWGRPDSSDYDSAESRVRYIKTAFTSLADYINKTKLPNVRIGLPLIGCGLAGGKWATIEPIIKETLSRCNGTTTIVHYC